MSGEESGVDPTDLSSYYFGKVSVESAPYVGPVAVEVKEETASSSNGRGLVAARDLSAGECLFVLPSAVAADAEKVRGLWKERQTDDASCSSIERLSEQVLVEACIQAVQDEKWGIVNSLTALESGSGSARESTTTSMDRLLGKDETPPTDREKLLSVEHWQQVARRNAFGPDFITTEVVERRWKQDADWKPPRLTAHFPVAAMINHGCRPNAVRVFAGDVMIVHTCHSVSEGDELLWSYIPVALPYPERQKRLGETHGFVCRCERCAAEEPVWKRHGTRLDKLARSPPAFAWRQLEEFLSSEDLSSNEVKRYVRTCYVPTYMQSLNDQLLIQQTFREGAPNDAVVASVSRMKKELLDDLCTQLHFSLAATHNASTEHVSILHVCYDLASALHVDAEDQSQTIGQVRFWTDQLKRAVMVRYGPLGHSPERVRRMMQHTRTVLRQKDGMDAVQHKFI
jgi:hypothetical protein